MRTTKHYIVATKERDEAMATLRRILKPGQTVYTILRHVSDSGMSRDIGIVLIQDNLVFHPNYAVASVLDLRMGRSSDSVRVNGCGMDMGFSIVYDLGAALYNDTKAFKHNWL